jgi:hypothetical protein
MDPIGETIQEGGRLDGVGERASVGSIGDQGDVPIGNESGLGDARYACFAD